MVIYEDDLMHCPFAHKIRLCMVLLGSLWWAWESAGCRNHKADLNCRKQLFAWSIALALLASLSDGCLSPGLDPMDVGGYGGKAHVCTSAFRVGHHSWLCPPLHPVWMYNGELL